LLFKQEIHMTITADKLPELAQCAHRIRRFALRMGEVQGQGYIGQALGWADVLAVAYGHALNYRASDPDWEERDRFLLSHGHYAIAHYAALIEAKIISEDELETYGSDDSRLPMSGMEVTRPAWKSPVALWGRVCRLAWALLWPCATSKARPLSTTPCQTVNWMKDPLGRPPCRRPITNWAT
jgi:hypothetical protein